MPSRPRPAPRPAALPTAQSPPARYLVVHPYEPRGRRPAGAPPVAYSVYPPAGNTPYDEDQAAAALHALQARWIEARSWPPPHLEPWAEPAADPASGLRVRPAYPAAPPPGAIVLRVRVGQAFDRLAAARKTTARRLLLSDDVWSLVETDADVLYARVLRHLIQKGDFDDPGDPPDPWDD